MPSVSALVRPAALAALALAMVGCTGTGGSPTPDELVGTWTIDLRPTPDAPAYLQTMRIDAVDGRTVTGSFYDTPIQRGLVNDDWETVYFGFVTSDGSGEYVTQGRIEDGRVSGTTLSVGRDFLAVWTGVRASESGDDGPDGG